MKALQQFPLAGNVRQLSGVVEQAIASCEEQFIQFKHLPAIVKAATANKSSRVGIKERLDAFIKEMFGHELVLSGSNFPKAASILKVTASYTRRLASKFGLKYAKAARTSR